MVLKDGEVREFDVRFKTVKRTTIKTLRGFGPESIDVSITGIFFCWQENDLLPCVDENGVSDVEKMEVIQPPVWAYCWYKIGKDLRGFIKKKKLK